MYATRSISYIDIHHRNLTVKAGSERNLPQNRWSPFSYYELFIYMYIATFHQQIVYAVYIVVVFHIMISLIAPNREAIESRIPSG